MTFDQLEECFMKDQVREIEEYLKRHQGENPNHVVLQWIENNAADFRRHWHEEHLMA